MYTFFTISISTKNCLSKLNPVNYKLQLDRISSGKIQLSIQESYKTLEGFYSGIVLSD